MYIYDVMTDFKEVDGVPYLARRSNGSGVDTVISYAIYLSLFYLIQEGYILLEKTH